MAKATKESLAESRRKAKIENHLERKETIQEDDIIAYVEAMSMEGHKKKLAEDVTLKVLVGKVFEEIILESLKTLFTKKVQRKAAEEATMFDVDGEPVSEEVILESRHNLKQKLNKLRWKSLREFSRLLNIELRGSL